MIIRYSPRAIADIIAIADYIAARNKPAALAVEAAILTTVSLLAEHPNLGVDRPKLQVRSISVPRYPYTVYYRAQDEAIIIVHVRDERRRPIAEGDL